MASIEYKIIHHNQIIMTMKKFKWNLSLANRREEIYPETSEEQKRKDLILVLIVHGVLFFTLVAIDMWIKLH